MKNLLAICCVLFLFGSCKTTAGTTTETTQNQDARPERAERPQRQGGQNGGRQGGSRPDPATMIAQMDANKDGKLSKDEVKGPISRDFAKIDTNSDGFITKEELEAGVPRQ